MNAYAGFDGNGQFEFAAGSVTGLRWWRLQETAPDWSSHYGTTSPRKKWWLRGQVAYWYPYENGENTATCHANYIATCHGSYPRCRPCDVPAPPCGCGFWAYWRNNGPFAMEQDVAGVIEGHGKTLIGSLGMRCAKARILALSPLAGWLANQPARIPASQHLMLQDYGDIPVYRSITAMLADFPLTTEYLPKQPSEHYQQLAYKLFAGYQAGSLTFSDYTAGLGRLQQSCPDLNSWLNSQFGGHYYPGGSFNWGSGHYYPGGGFNFLSC